MNFLKDPPKFLFFTGKGGVGKTSIACGTALAIAEQGKKVLLVSTDPASNVGQVFGLAIGRQITPVPGALGLAALEIDPQAAAAAYRERIVGPVRGRLPDGVVARIEEQLSGACTTEIAAFDEFTALLTDGGVLAQYDHVVFDTAPTGHTIRLLQLPGAWTGFLESSRTGASCLGPLAGLDKHRQQYRDSVAVLTDARQTRLILVTRAQRSALQEAARTQAELATTGIVNQYLVINGIMPESETADPLAAAVSKRERQALADMPSGLRDLPTDILNLLPFNLVGLPALRSLFARELSTTPGPASGSPFGEAEFASLGDLVRDLEDQGKGLVMLMGKGGVGKTMLAAAIAVELASRGHHVHLTTTDPAAHLDAGLADDLPALKVSRIDPSVETERYRQHILATKGSGLDPDGLALLEEDLRSPCTEEIAVFQAFSGAVRESRSAYVVVDTAPTGHTLLLLDATGAYHREVMRHLKASGDSPITPMRMLQDRDQRKILIVTLAETTPVLEAAQLQEDLRRASIEPWAWIVNNTLAVARHDSPLLAARAASEGQQIQMVLNHHAGRLSVVAMQPEEPEGMARLSELTRAPAASTAAAR